MSRHNETLVRRFIQEIFTNKNIAALDGFLAPDYVDHFLPPELPPGLEGNRRFFTSLFNAFPDLTYSLEDVFSAGDKVVCRDCISATHQGVYWGMPATGRRVSFTGICILRLRGDRLVEHWHEVDRLRLMQQLTSRQELAAGTAIQSSR
jgi:predicted ester cyclase